MRKYRVTVEVQLDDNIAPDQIQTIVEEDLTRDNVHFQGVRVRNIEGEFPGDQDDFNEWRYCLGPYSHLRERMIEFLKSGRSGPHGFRLGPQ